ncbi:hypothetical protein [Brevibacillus daliensis]|uniref:hypothetical protein n=1 Tax=Brevibacillus daliensis TaxID=2892995 RepID=UPI001E3F09DB|nr:hypothetical protein [Brevibacillus daliensis]
MSENLQQQAVQIHMQSRVDMSHLSIQPDGDEYTVGDPNLREFIRVPEEAVMVIRLMDGSKTVEEVQAKLLTEHGVEVDVLDFAEALLEMNLIRSVDDQILIEHTQIEAKEWMRKLGQFFYGKVGVTLYSICAAAVVAIYLVRTDLFPTFQDAFVLSSIGLNTLLIFVVSWFLLLIHEIGHLLAAARLGISARLRLSLRLYWLVVETDMTGMWSQPKQQRYVPYLAGMLWDSVLLLGALFVQLMLSTESFWFGFSKMVALVLLFRLTWQFLVFIRTDMYFVMINSTNTSNLMMNTQTFLKSLVRIKLKEEEAREWDNLSAQEKTVSKRYSLFYVLGCGIALWLLVALQIPIVYQTLMIAGQNMLQNPLTTIQFWDGSIVAILFVLEVVLWLIGASNAYKTRRNNRVQATA